MIKNDHRLKIIPIQRPSSVHPVCFNQLNRILWFLEGIKLLAFSKVATPTYELNYDRGEWFMCVEYEQGIARAYSHHVPVFIHNGFPFVN